MKRNSEIELVTFEEWWSLIDPDYKQRVEETGADMIEIINALYVGYFNWCWYRGCDHEEKNEIIKRYRKEQ